MKFKSKIVNEIFLTLIFAAVSMCLVACNSEDVSSTNNTSSVIFYTPTISFETTAEATPDVTPDVTVTQPPAVTKTPEKTPLDSDFVKIKDYIPTVVIDLKYATTDNFTGQVIYDFTEPQARYGTVKKLMRAAELLEEKGYYIKIWDAYRPVYAQYRLWEICPDGNYVSNPNVGYSNHNRGCAVDLTLVDFSGKEVVMPTGFDDFSLLADRDYSDVSSEAAANSELLEKIMESCGFSGYYNEWWHYNDTVKYDPA